MASGYCQICINHCLLPDFLFFHCGHGFCTSCIQSLFRERRKTTCPNCRVPVTRQDAHAIFFDIIDPKVSPAVTVVEGLNKMGEASKLISVRRAEEKLRKVAENLEVGEDTASMLLQAVGHFKERIIPTFTKVEAQMEEIASFRRDLDAARHENKQLDAKYQKARKLEMDVRKMKETVSQMSSERDKAISLAEEACQETVKLREAKEVSASAITALEEENERYRDQLQMHMKLERTRKDKITKLKQEITMLKMSKEVLNSENKDASHPPMPAHVTYPSTQDILMPVRSANTLKSIPAYKIQGSSIRHDFEGMPPPSFASGWQIEAPKSKKRKHSVIDNGAQNSEFPIGLNRGGHPMKTVQLGPKISLRAPLSLRL